MGILSPEMLLGIDPVRQGILSAGFAGLEASGPSPTPVSLGQVIGRAGSAGMGSYNSSLNSLRQLAQTQALIDLEKQKTALTEAQVRALLRQEDFKRQILERYMRGAGGGLAPNAALAPTPPGMSETTSQLAFGSPQFATPPSPPPSPQQPGGFAVTPEEAFLLKLGGAGDFTELAKFLNTPQHVPAGSYSGLPGQQPRYLPDPSKGIALGASGAIEEMPGASTLAGIAARAAAAVKAAEQPYGTPVVRNIPGIGPISLAPDQDTRYSRTGELPGDPPAQLAPSVPPAPLAPPAQLAPSQSGAGRQWRDFMQPASPEEAAAIAFVKQNDRPGNPVSIQLGKPLVPRRPGALVDDATQAADKIKAEGEARRELERPERAAQIREASALLDRVANTARALRDHQGLSRITGILGRVPNFPEGVANDALAQLNTLKAQSMIKELQAMRDASKTGGALGAISERELDLLINAIGALDRVQQTATFKRELDKIIGSVARTKGRAARAFAETYGAEHAREFKLTPEEIQAGLNF